MKHGIFIELKNCWPVENKQDKTHETNTCGEPFKCYKYKKLGKQERNDRICMTLAG